MLLKEARKFFAACQGALSVASLVPRGRCGEEYEGGAKKGKKTLGQHSDARCDCVWLGVGECYLCLISPYALHSCLTPH